MSAAARDSPGTIHANLESTDDEVVFLFEEIGHTRRNRALPPRSNSAGEPIVISSDEEDMASRHPHPPTLYSPLPRRHRHRCLERSRPHHHYHRSPSRSGKHRPSPRGEKWRDHTHSRPGQDDVSVAHRRLHGPMDYYAYRSYNGKKTPDCHKVESRSRVSRPSHGSPSPSMGYSTESSFSRRPTPPRFTTSPPPRFTPPPPPRVTPPPLPRFTTSPPSRFTPPPPPRITPPPPPRFTPPPPPRSTTPPSPRFISPLRRHNGHTPSRTPLPTSTHPNGVTRKKLIVEYTIPPARKRKRADSPGQDSEVKRKKHESSYPHSHHHPHSHYSHSHHPHPHTHSHHPHTHHSPSHTSPILNGTKSNFDKHKNLNSDRHKTSSTSSFSAANNRHYVKVKSESPTPEKKVEKRKRERGKDLPPNSTGHTLIKQESSNRAHLSPEPSLTPDHRPNLHPSSLLLASAARTRPFTSAPKTPPSLPSKSRTRLKLSLERGKRVQGRELHKPQTQTPHREEKGERGTGKGTTCTSRSSPQEMCRRRLPGICPAQSQGPCEPQTLTPCREEKESRRGSVEEKDATPGISPRRMNCHRPPCTSPAKSQATPTRQTRLESYLLLDPDATPPLKQATPTQSQQESPASSMVQHYPSTATTLVTSPVSPPPEEGMTFPPPSLPSAGGVGAEGDHLRHSVAIPPWTTDELKEKSKPLSSPSVDPLLSGLCAVSLQADSGTPYTNFSWNALDTCAQAMEGRDGKRCEQYVRTLEELTSRGCFIPGHHLEIVLRTVLNLTNTGLLLRVHSVLVSDAALRTTTGLSASLLWDLMELCCTKLSQGLTTPANGSAGVPYPLSAHVVLLYLAALLVKDLAISGTEMDSSLVERTLSLTSKWQHVLVVLDLLFKLLPNDPSPSSLPDLCSVLSVLVCLSVMTSQECDQDNGTSRLARELSLRVARLPTTHLKMHFLLLLPCHLLREKVINIHFSTEFLLPQASSQNCGLASDHVSFELIADSHLRRAPYHHDGTPHDLSLFLFLQCNLLQSHCAQLLGLYPDHTHWTTPPTSAPLSPAQLANQLQPIASQIRALPRRLSEDLALLTDLTSPLCWFHLQILERLTSCGQQ